MQRGCPGTAAATQRRFAGIWRRVRRPAEFGDGRGDSEDGGSSGAAESRKTSQSADSELNLIHCLALETAMSYTHLRLSERETIATCILPATAQVRLPGRCSVLPARSAGNWRGTARPAGTAFTRRRSVLCRVARTCSPFGGCFRAAGVRSRWPAVCASITKTIPACECLIRRSTVGCGRIPWHSTRWVAVFVTVGIAAAGFSASRSTIG